MCKYCEIKYADEFYQDEVDFCLNVEAIQSEGHFSIEPYFNEEYPASLYYHYGKDAYGNYHHWGSVQINFCPWCGRNLQTS